MYMHNSVQAIYVLSSCRVLSVIDRKDQIHLGFPLKSNCLGYVLGGRVYCIVTIAYYSYSHNILITNLSFRNNSFGGNN